MYVHNLKVILGNIFENSMQKVKKQAFRTWKFWICSIVSMQNKSCWCGSIWMLDFCIRNAPFVAPSESEEKLLAWHKNMEIRWPLPEAWKLEIKSQACGGTGGFYSWCSGGHMCTSAFCGKSRVESGAVKSLRPSFCQAWVSTNLTRKHRALPSHCDISPGLSQP